MVRKLLLYIYNVLGDIILDINSDKLSDKTEFDLTNKPIRSLYYWVCSWWSFLLQKTYFTI